MSSRTSTVEWVEEVVIIEDCLPSDPHDSQTGIPVLQPTETPIQKLLDTVGRGGSPEAAGGFYCDECLHLFQDQDDSSDPTKFNGPSFILDFPTSPGVPQRALLTLPYGLVVGRSSIPHAGVGVINHGPLLVPGMHFGPYEGEKTTMENAVASVFSWEICKGKGEYEYIDAARETLANWMRYVNCARGRDEANLLAVQYKGSILFHCCRPVHPDDELLVWPGSKLLEQFSQTWTQMWLLKLKAAESVSPVVSQVFMCSHCPLSFTTNAFLQRHTENRHLEPLDGNLTPTVEAAELENPASELENPASELENPTSEPDPSVSTASLVVLSVDTVQSKTCTDCGKIFKQTPHLKRHKLCVHSNKRPYCCQQCRRSFSQASGLTRHQRIHRKQTVIRKAVSVPTRESITREQSNGSELTVGADPSRAEEPIAGETGFEAVDEADKETTGEAEAAQQAEQQPNTCSECEKRFINEASLKKHKELVHDKLRPYVCTVCQKCFGQFHDLTRHLRRHRKQSEEGLVQPFSCAKCSLAFSSVDALQQHISGSHLGDTHQEGEEEDPAAVSDDPDYIQPPSAAETVQKHQRPQRRGARSKIYAVTKLIAPKRRTNTSKKLLAGAADTEDCSDAEAPAVRNGKLKHKWFSCNRCKKTYGTSDDLKAHACALGQHACGQCGATFKKSGFLRRHERTMHVNAKSFCCESCGKVFSTSGKLKQHQKLNTCKKYHCTSELFSCSFCQFSFTMKSYLVKHIRRHHPVEYLSLPKLDTPGELPEPEEKEYACPHCGKDFAGAKAFKSHECFQQVKVLYVCTQCGKGFANHYGLKQHQRTHTGERPYSCPHCSKSFSHSGQLNVHLRTHTGEKPYLCTHCGESFRQSGDLKRHERKHTGVRPYSCPECCKSFSRPQSLKAHQMLHRGQRMFKCTQCGKSFSRNYHLRRHHQKMHL